MAEETLVLDSDDRRRDIRPHLVQGYPGAPPLFIRQHLAQQPAAVVIDAPGVEPAAVQTRGGGRDYDQQRQQEPQPCGTI